MLTDTKRYYQTPAGNHDAAACPREVAIVVRTAKGGECIDDTTRNSVKSVDTYGMATIIGYIWDGSFKL